MVLDIVTKDRQKPHVHNQVQPGSMHEHGTEQGNDRGIGRNVTGDPLIQMAGHESKLENKNVAAAGRKRNLEQENQNVDDNQKIVDGRGGGAWCVITDGDHFLPRIGFDYDAG